MSELEENTINHDQEYTKTSDLSDVREQERLVCVYVIKYQMTETYNVCIIVMRLGPYTDTPIMYVKLVSIRGGRFISKNFFFRVRRVVRINK